MLRQNPSKRLTLKKIISVLKPIVRLNTKIKTKNQNKNKNKTKKLQDKKIRRKILSLVKKNKKLAPFTKNVTPSSVDTDPWKGNFEIVSYEEDKNFCNSVTDLLGEKKPALFVAINAVCSSLHSA